MAEASFEGFQVDAAGIRSIFRGAEMCAVLDEAAQSMASGANAEAAGRDPNTAAHYAGGVDVLRGTAVGWVGTANAAARMDEAEHHTLEHQNH